MEKLTVLRRLAAVVFPERCACCDDVIPPGDGVCAVCEAKLPYIGTPVCPYCGVEKAYCDCKKRRRYFERVVAPMYYDGVAETGIRRMKKSGDRLAASFFAEETAETVRQYYGDIVFDAVVYVPTDEKAMQERGFNPGQMVAELVAKELQLPLWHALYKLFETPPQKSLSAVERSGNLLGAFDLTADCDVAGKTLLLVDDIVTTGSTLDECAKMLKIYGASAVFAATVMATRKKTDNAAQ